MKNKKERQEIKNKEIENHSPLFSSPSFPGKVVSINTSQEKGVPKKPVQRCKIHKEYGLVEDAHAGPWHRQVSLLASESIKEACSTGIDFKPGDFAENITTSGIILTDLLIGTSISIGSDVLLEVTQIGKKCHARCAIYDQVGDCIMPREGIFARVIRGGEVAVGDIVKVIDSGYSKF